MEIWQGPLPNLIPPESAGMTGIRQESQGHDKDLQGGDKYTVSVFDLGIDLIIVFIIRDQCWEIAFRTGGETPGFNLPRSAFFTDLISAARAAPSWAARHLYVSGHPVNVRVVLLQPRVSHNYFLLSETRYGKEGFLGVVLVPEYQFYHFMYGAGLV